MVYTALFCRCLIGVVFLASGVTKLRSRQAFAIFVAWLDGFSILRSLSTTGRQALAIAMAAGDVVVVVTMVSPWTATAGFVLAAVLLAGFAAGAVIANLDGARIPCRCFGVSESPLGWRHVSRNAALCAVAAVGAITTSAHGVAHPAGIAIAVVLATIAAVTTMLLDDLVTFLLDHKSFSHKRS